MLSTVAGWIAYAAARGTVIADDADSAAALVRAQDYIQHHYVSRFGRGFSEDSPNVEPAVYVAAALELTTPGFFSNVFTPSEQKVLTEVSGIKWTLVGGGSGANASTPVSTSIEAMLQPYLGGNPGLGLRAVG